jgi:ATP-binding cassette subfamily B protein RaxB
MGLFARRVPLILQTEAPECVVACVAMVASYHGLRTDLSAMRLRLSPSMKGMTLQHVAAICEAMQMSFRGVQAPLSKLPSLRLPAILHWDMNHFVVLAQADAKRAVILDPARGRRVMPIEEVSRHYTGVAAELAPASGFQRRDERQSLPVRRLLGSMEGLRGTLAQILLLSVALEVFAVVAPFFVQLVVDRVVVGRDEDLLTLLGTGFALLALVQVAVSAARGWFGVYLSTVLNVRLLDSLFGQLLRLPMLWFEKRHIGDIVARFRSVDTIQRTLSVGFLEALVDGTMVVLTLLVMLWYSVPLSVVVVAAAALYGLLRWSLHGVQRRALDEQLVMDGKAATHFIETLRGMVAIKLNLREGERRSAYQNLVIDSSNASVQVQRLALLHRAGNGLIFGLENVAVVWLAALLVLDGRFSVGMLFGFLSFQLIFTTRVNNLVDKVMEFRMLELHAERIADIALAPAEAARAQAHAPEGPLAIEGRGLGFSYGVEGFAFRGVDFSVRPGEVVAVVGPSGCGKTTLIKVIVGLLDRTEGTLTACGRDLREWDLKALRSRISVVMQEETLFVGSVEDNICFFDPQHDPEHVREAARLAGIDEDISAMPMQYNTIVGSLGVALSGGQKQRVLLARALYRKPQILFLDEAFDQLDLAREREISTRLRATGIGIVIVSHRPETVSSVDRVIRMGPPAPGAPARPPAPQ